MYNVRTNYRTDPNLYRKTIIFFTFQITVIILCASYFTVQVQIYLIGKESRSLIIQLGDGPFPVTFKVQYVFQILGALCLTIKGVPKLLTSCKVT